MKAILIFRLLEKTLDLPCSAWIIDYNTRSPRSIAGFISISRGMPEQGFKLIKNERSSSSHYSLRLNPTTETKIFPADVEALTLRIDFEW